MKNWLFSVFALSIFTELLNLFLKKTQLQKSIQAILSVLLSITFVQPMLRLKDEKNFLFTEWEEETLEVSKEIKDIISQNKETYFQNKISEKLFENGVVSEVQIYGNFDDTIKIEKVLIKLNLSSISSQKMNIVEIRRMVSAYCEVNEEDVTVYAQ